MAEHFPGANLYDVIRRSYLEAGARTAIEFAGRRTDYRALLANVDQRAQGLQALGIESGDRVAFLARNCPEILELYIAVAKIGAILVPINAELAPGEIAFVVDHSEPTAIYCDLGCSKLLDLALAQSHHRPPVLTLAPVDDKAKSVGLDGNAATSAGGGGDGVIICYTSGSTGRPKGILASHSVEIASAEAYRRIWHIGPSDRVLIALPLAYLYGLTTSGLTALSSGASIVLLDRFHPASVLQAIEHQGATIFMGVPTMFAMLADYAESLGRSIRASDFRLAISAGAALSPTIALRFKSLFRFEIQEFYALSEIRPVFAFDIGSSVLRIPGSVGTAAAEVEVRLVDDNGKPSAPGEEGELMARSPTLMLGYYREPELTAQAMPDGWFRTGDRARVDSQGRYFITGRVKELIIRGGAKIAPAEVEAALMRHPDVREAAVVGVPDATFGEIVKAAVVIRPGRRPSAEELQSHCAGHLASFKVPAMVVFMDALPTGPTGKVLKRVLIDAH